MVRPERGERSMSSAARDPYRRQLLLGDVLGFALLSGSLVWSALGLVA